MYIQLSNLVSKYPVCHSLRTHAYYKAMGIGTFYVVTIAEEVA